MLDERVAVTLVPQSFHNALLPDAFDFANEYFMYDPAMHACSFIFTASPEGPQHTIHGTHLQVYDAPVLLWSRHMFYHWYDLWLCTCAELKGVIRTIYTTELQLPVSEEAHVGGPSSLGRAA